MENLIFGLGVMVIGLLVVFLGLIILIVFIKVLSMITDRPSGRSVQLTERLRDTPACTAPQTDIRYLPGLRRVLLLGVVLEGGVPGAHCVALPEAAAAAAR